MGLRAEESLNASGYDFAMKADGDQDCCNGHYREPQHARAERLGHALQQHLGETHIRVNLEVVRRVVAHGGLDLADDLLQQTFLSLADRGPELRADSNVRAWLFTVARNAYMSHARHVETGSISDGPYALTDPTPEIEARLLLGDLEAALGALRVEDRELLLLVGVEGLEPVEAAAVLGINATALRQRLARARSRLLVELERCSSTKDDCGKRTSR